jgi:hypothetical protein
LIDFNEKIDFDKSYDLVIIGNITKDYINDSEQYILGGSSLYAGIASANIGVNTMIISNHSINHKELPEFEKLQILSSDHEFTTEFLWTYENDKRFGYLNNKTKTIELNFKRKLKTKMLMLAPVFDEIEINIKDNFEYEICLLSPQGLLRSSNGNSKIFLDKNNLQHLICGVHIISCSEEEENYLYRNPSAENCFDYISVTLGNKGSKLYNKYNCTHFPGYIPDKIIDPTGAGDVFSLYLLVFYYKTNNIEFAVKIANCAASFVVEGLGISTIPSFRSVKKRLMENINE